MVCFNANQIYLHFDNHVTITVEGTLTYQSASNGVVQKLSPPVSETNLMQLVGHKLEQITGKSNGTLSLAFDDNSIVECLDTSPDYESYQLSFEGRLIVI